MKHFLVALSLCLLAFTPVQDEVRISWTQDLQLTWDDFQGTPQYGTTYVASTNSGLSFKYGYKVINGSPTSDFNFEVTSFFYPELSWYVADRVTPRVLKHEQTHFDISELHARMLRKRIAEYNFSSNVKAELDALYDSIEAERRALQKQFDLETDHSTLRDKELEWEQKIAELLIQYQAWQ